MSNGSSPFVPHQIDRKMAVVVVGAAAVAVGHNAILRGCRMGLAEPGAAGPAGPAEEPAAVADGSPGGLAGSATGTQRTDPDHHGNSWTAARWPEPGCTASTKTFAAAMSAEGIGRIVEGREVAQGL